jgi:hypothetical protein
MHADADKQGLVQGMITGMRGLCNGLGPAMFGLIFSLFNVNLNEQTANNGNHSTNTDAEEQRIVPGPPFVFGSLLVILAVLVAAFIPDNVSSSSTSGSASATVERRVSRDYHKKKTDEEDADSDLDMAPLIHTVRGGGAGPSAAGATSAL